MDEKSHLSKKIKIWKQQFFVLKIPQNVMILNIF